MRVRTISDTVMLTLVALLAASEGFVASAMRRRDMPIPLARYLRSNVIFNHDNICRHHCEWVTVDSGVSGNVMHRYFNVCDMRPTQSCELFLIEGVPAASMLYTINNTRGGPMVDSFHLNRGLLMLFDGGHLMRSKLRSRHSYLNTRFALNRMDYLLT